MKYNFFYNYWQSSLSKCGQLSGEIISPLLTCQIKKHISFFSTEMFKQSMYCTHFRLFLLHCLKTTLLFSCTLSCCPLHSNQASLGLKSPKRDVQQATLILFWIVREFQLPPLESLSAGTRSVLLGRIFADVPLTDLKHTTVICTASN